MAVLLLKSYGGYNSGATVELTAELEASLIAQGLASVATVANVTTGATSTSAYSGTVSVPIGAASLVVTNSNVVANSKVYAVVAQATADGTLLRVERIVCADGSFTIYGTAAATAATLVDWAIINGQGMTIRN